MELIQVSMDEAGGVVILNLHDLRLLTSTQRLRLAQAVQSWGRTVEELEAEHDGQEGRQPGEGTIPLVYGTSR